MEMIRQCILSHCSSLFQYTPSISMITEEMHLREITERCFHYTMSDEDNFAPLFLSWCEQYECITFILHFLVVGFTSLRVWSPSRRVHHHHHHCHQIEYSTRVFLVQQPLVPLLNNGSLAAWLLVWQILSVPLEDYETTLEQCKFLPSDASTADVCAHLVCQTRTNFAFPLLLTA